MNPDNAKSDEWTVPARSDLSDKIAAELKARGFKFLGPFQRPVYEALLEVPRGSVTTYGALARRIGCRSAQAVGQALKANPFAPRVPCHRVVAADGSLGGFCGQREGKEILRKRRLLESRRLPRDEGRPAARAAAAMPIPSCISILPFFFGQLTDGISYFRREN